MVMAVAIKDFNFLPLKNFKLGKTMNKMKKYLPVAIATTAVVAKADTITIPDFGITLGDYLSAAGTALGSPVGIAITIALGLWAIRASLRFFRGNAK